MAALTITVGLLERAALYNSFALPDHDMVFFGIRGALPIDAGGGQFAPAHQIRFAAIDHLKMRCTIGQWDRAGGRIALFPASTVPSAGNLLNALKGGDRANMLIPGRYVHEKGIHKKDRPNGHRAFRQASFFPVLRTNNDTVFDRFDDIDFGGGPGDFVADNIHSAFFENPEAGFSSAGCQVVAGLPSSPRRNMAPETGSWRTFVENAYAIPQQRFVYLLFLSQELASVENSGPAPLRQVVRYGSSGGAAAAVQQALIARAGLTPPADGNFGRNSLMALTRFQESAFGAAAVDGVCGPNTAAALGVELPLVSGAAAAAPASAPPEINTSQKSDIPDETDMPPGRLASLLARIGKVREPSEDEAAAAAGFSRKAFFDSARQSLFSGALRDSQVQGINGILDVWQRGHQDADPRWLAYILAGVCHETGRMMIPVREGFKQSDAAAREHVRNMFLSGRISRDYAAPVNGISYFGRGRIQNTHLANYEKLTRRFGKDFVHEPNLLLDAAIDAEVTVAGHVEGLWTGHKLGDFIAGSRCDYTGARRIVNAQDKALEIAAFAAAFERAIAAAAAAPLDPAFTPDPAPAPIPGAPLPPPAPKPSGGLSMADENSALNARLDRIEAALAALAGQQPAPAAGPPGGAAPPDDGSNADRIKAIQEFINKVAPGAAGLTPVNGALGELIGKPLDGRKTAFGMLGAIAASLVNGSGGESALGKIAETAGTALPLIKGMSGPALPVFLGLAAWGVLGKLDKWRLGKK